MLATIHNITDDVIFRKSINWKNTKVQSADSINCEKMYLALESCFNTLITKNPCKKLLEKVDFYIKNLFSIKEKLNHPCWHIPTNLTAEEFKCFLQDTNFYLMISGVLIKANSMFSGFISGFKNFSLASLLPKFSSNPKKIKEALSFLPSCKWINTVTYYSGANFYLNALGENELLISKISESESIYPVLKSLHKDLSSQPVSQKEEDYLTMKLLRVNELLKDISVSMEWDRIRSIILTGLFIVADHRFYKLQYIKMLKENVDVCNKEVMAQELCFVKNELEQLMLTTKQGSYRMSISLQYFKQLVKDIKKLAESKEPKISGYLEWTHNPKEFVKTIHSAIENGYISLKGNKDLKPIVEFISRFVKVKKQNNSGVLKVKSLISYFKQANTGDL